MNSLNKLSAKKFVIKKTYKEKFNKILEICIHAHSLLLNENMTKNLVEEKLRNKLLKYIEKMQGSYMLANYVFVAESAEIDEITDDTVGYNDIRVYIPCNSDFSNEGKKYFTIECKRLDGYSDKNKEYIEEGMNRFISEKYICKLDICGMIGFIEKSKKIYKYDKTQEIVNAINNKLINVYNKNETEKLQASIIKEDFINSYQSKHIRDKCKLPIYISHLFFDNNN